MLFTLKFASDERKAQVRMNTYEKSLIFS